MNMRAVFLHVMADALGSVIVIISALLNIYRKPLNIPDKIIMLIDPVLCLALVVLILLSTLPLRNYHGNQFHNDREICLYPNFNFSQRVGADSTANCSKRNRNRQAQIEN